MSLCRVSLRPIMILCQQPFMMCCVFHPVKPVYLPLKRNFARNFILKKYFHSSFTKKLETTEQDSSSDSSSSSSDENYDNEECQKEEALDAKILEAALPFVKEYGWTTDAIAQGAEILGYSGMVHGMFEKGGTDLVNYFYSNCNSQLEVKLQRLLKEQEDGKMKRRTTEFISTAVELRLRMNAEFIDSWAKALVLHAAPTNFSVAFTNFGTLIDTIWHYAGDKSTDFNWYTKRAILAAVYKSTELCMLQDNSEDFQDTWAFLERRLKDIQSAANIANQTTQRTKDVSDVLQVGFITMQNILELNMKYRR